MEGLKHYPYTQERTKIKSGQLSIYQFDKPSILEELIKDQVISHLKVNNLISSVQHGFTERRSWLTNLLISLEMITKAVDEDCPVDTIYFDFSEAFDTVPHYRLLHKLKSMGINKNTFLWIKYFLSE